MFRKPAILVLLLLFCSALSAQEREMDSVRKILHAATSPARKAECNLLLSELVYRKNADSTEYFASEGLKLIASISKSDTDTTIRITEAALLNNRAFVYQRKAKYYEAIKAYQKSIEVYPKQCDQRGVASTYMNLGTLYRDVGEYDLALSNLVSASKTLRNGDHTGFANCEMGIGSIKIKQKKYQEALNHLFSALALAEQTKDTRAIGRIQLYLGQTYVAQRNNKAPDFFRNAIASFEAAGEQTGLSESHFLLAKTMLSQSQLDSAEYHATKAFEYAKITGFPGNYRDASEILYSIYSRQGKMKEALSMHEMFKTMDDSLRAQEIVRSAIRDQLRSDYETREALLKAEQEKKDIVSREQIKRQRLVITISIAAAVMLLSLLLVVFRNYIQKKRSNQKISEQKLQLEQKSREVEDSILCARRIQQALLPADKAIGESFPRSFIFYQPRDIVSGDFYWICRQPERTYIAVCDSTGHGVPGAFVSLLNISFLNEAVNDKNITSPGEIFDFVRQRLTEKLIDEETQEGMDGILVCYDHTQRDSVSYAAANNRPMIVLGNEVVSGETDKMPVGKSYHTQPFRTFTVPFSEKHLLVLTTDGYADQFGGPAGKKFKYKQLVELVGRISGREMSEMRAELSATFEKWKGKHEQIDDVLVAGIQGFPAKPTN